MNEFENVRKSYGILRFIVVKKKKKMKSNNLNFEFTFIPLSRVNNFFFES